MKESMMIVTKYRKADEMEALTMMVMAWSGEWVSPDAVADAAVRCFEADGERLYLVARELPSALLTLNLRQIGGLLPHRQTWAEWVESIQEMERFGL